MFLIRKIIVSLLVLESRLILRKYKPFIIAVTGSVGKTSTKDAIYTVLKDYGRYVRKSDKSFNSDIGLPLTVIGVPNAWRSASAWLGNIIAGLKLIFTKNEYPEVLVLEIGADHPGDICRVTKWLHPDISVITRVSATPVHVEFFASPLQVFEEKACLATAVKSGGTLVLFADDEKVMSLGERVKDKNVKVVSFGISPSATIRGSEERFIYDPTSGLPSGFSFKLSIEGNSIPVNIKRSLGQTSVLPLLASAGVARARGLSVGDIIQALNDCVAPKGRMNIISGKNGSMIIDDTYNSSPDAVSSALSVLKSLDCKSSKIAILGDMMELGKYSSAEHRRIGVEVASSASRLITVGQRSRTTAEEAVKNGLPVDKVNSFDTALEAGEFVSSVIGAGDIILVKGSQSMRMERVVKVLMNEPEKASDLLVRQEKEWLEKA